MFFYLQDFVYQLLMSVWVFL